MLRKVTLRVSDILYDHKKMFGTEVEKNEVTGEQKDPCGGDSGGPLMYESPASGRWVIIGW